MSNYAKCTRQDLVHFFCARKISLRPAHVRNKPAEMQVCFVVCPGRDLNSHDVAIDRF